MTKVPTDFRFFDEPHAWAKSILKEAFETFKVDDLQELLDLPDLPDEQRTRILAARAHLRIENPSKTDLRKRTVVTKKSRQRSTSAGDPDSAPTEDDDRKALLRILRKYKVHDLNSLRRLSRVPVETVTDANALARRLKISNPTLKALGYRVPTAAPKVPATISRPRQPFIYTAMETNRRKH